MSSLAIDIQHVTRRFGDIVAVDDLSLSVESGEVFGILGHNGAGKTTTIRLLNGVLMPDSGDIRVLGFNPHTEGTKLRAHTGVLTETPSVDERLTATDNLTIYADLYGIPVNQVQQRVASVLDQFGLTERASEKVGGYSKGMKQRLALARAFLHEPQIMFLDEPTSGLDPIAIQNVHELIRHISHDEGRTVILCTHNLVEAQRLCDRVAVIEKGQLVAIGAPLELAEQIGADIHYSLQVAADQIDLAFNSLKGLPTVLHLHSTDSELVFTLKEREVVSDILTTLLENGIRIYAIQPQQTSLEDIYLALHQGKGRIS